MTETRRQSKVVQIWECPKCGYQLKAPMRYTGATCGNRHGTVRQQSQPTPLVLVWDAKDGEAAPE